MPIQKEDLSCNHYSWTEKSEHPFSGHPSRRSFDRFNGDQVLFIINFYGTLSEKFTVEEGREIENLINNHLPLDARSEMAVFNWLRTFQENTV